MLFAYILKHKNRRINNSFRWGEGQDMIGEQGAKVLIHV